MVTELTAEQIREMTMDGTIAGGMIPKTETALDALQAVCARLSFWTVGHPMPVLLELYTEHGAGLSRLIRGAQR